MKKYLILLLLLFSGQLVAQSCQTPMPANAFKQKMNQMALQPNDQQKLQLGKSILQGSCFLSTQVKDLATVFAGDYYRYEFCKRAWKHTFDPGNFFDVYDAFTTMSSAIRLYDYVIHQDMQHPDPGPSPAPPSWYPNLPYPSPAGYKGFSGCQLPQADNDFDILARPIIAQKNDAARRTESLKMFASNCVTMGQAMKLATLFDLESNRLAFLKEVFPKIYDMENYSYATDVFSNMPYKNDWLAYCPTIMEPVVDPPPVVMCEVTTQEFEDIKRSIGNVSVNSTKLALAKQIISTKKCFTVKQLAGIIELFSIESSRLEIALHSYDYCINQSDYYQLTETFSTTSSKDKLLEFIGSRK